MATLSRNTLAIAADCITGWTHTQIAHFFYENDVPDAVVSGSNKLSVAMNVLRHFEKKGDTAKLLDLIQNYLAKRGDYAPKVLIDALMRDGFAVAGHAIVDAEPDAIEIRSALLLLVEKYQSDFDVTTLNHHLAECESLFQQGKWDSSIGHCRNFVEQMLQDIASAIALASNEQPNLTQPRLVRDYLLLRGFFDEPEKRKLVDGVYGYFSEQGSHPGISTQSAARISKSTLLAFGFYVMEKYHAWREGSLVLI